MLFTINCCVISFYFVVSVIGIFLFTSQSVAGVKSNSLQRKQTDYGNIIKPSYGYVHKEDYSDLRGKYARLLKETGQTRSRLNGNRWPEAGMPILYNSKSLTIHKAKWFKCVLEKAVKLLRKYSCIPIAVVDVDDVTCDPPYYTLDCVLNEKVYFNKMKAQGMDPEAVLDFVWAEDKAFGCSSLVGREPDDAGAQVMNIGLYCDELALVVHEMIHALGFLHEHQRKDRDDYIHIYWDTIEEEFKTEFSKWPYISKDFGPYDIESIMHYDNQAFVDGPHKISIRVKQKSLENIEKPFRRTVSQYFGQLGFLSFYDKVKIRSVTHCPGIEDISSEVYDTVNFTALVNQVIKIDNGKREGANLRYLEKGC